VRKTFLLAVLAILLLGGGAILAVLYFTGPSTPAPAPADDAPPPDRGYPPPLPAPTGPVGPTGPGEQRQPPASSKAPAGVPMAPEPDPRADQMEAVRQDRFESSMDALNRRNAERLRKAGKQPGPAPQRPADSTQRQ
jgi:hypothetical protein